MSILTHARPAGHQSLAAIVSLACLLTSVIAPSTARAYVLEDGHWPSNQPIVLDLQLGSPGRTLLDGSTTWDQVAEAAVGVWNPYLGGGVQFQTNENNITPAKKDHINSVFFSSTVYGDGFGSDTLAITISFYNSSTHINSEADVLFNSAKKFDSYRGVLRYAGTVALYDFRRVAIHEFGHVLGLDHTPDNAVSIMTPYTGDIDTVQADDIAGVESIYGEPRGIPVISGTLNESVMTGESFTYAIQARGVPTSYQADGLPDGLVLNASTGVITGTPTVEGTFKVLLSATNADGTGTATLTLIVGALPVVTSPLNATVQVGQPFIYRITASHQPASFDATLPAGLSIDKTTGFITGTLAAVGYYAITLKASNSFGTATAVLYVQSEYDLAIVTLHTFRSGNKSVEGTNPGREALIQGTDGNFYGTTMYGGASDKGTIFRMAPDGTLITLHSFNSTDGSWPEGGLLQAADGNFYGTTSQGTTAAGSTGTIFRMTPDGMLTTLHNLTADEGSALVTSLVQGKDGGLYGVAHFGGKTATAAGSGTIFKLAPDGTLTVLHVFTDGTASGGGLVQAADGNFYGTSSGGAYGVASTIYKMTPDGTFTTVHTFDLSEGVYAIGTLAQGGDGNLYGSTMVGNGTKRATIFKVTLDGILTDLHALTGDIGYTASDLILGRNGHLYGTASGGGLFGVSIIAGKLFEMTPDGVLTILHTFPNSNGVPSTSTLVQGSDGEFYGTTNYGGSTGDGTIYRTALFSPPVTSSVPVVTLEVTTPSVTLGSGEQAVFTVRLSEPQPANVVVHYALKGSALNGTDYMYLKGTQKIKAGKTSKAIAVKPLGDLRGVGKRVVKMSLTADATYTVGTTTMLRVKIVAAK